MHQPIIRNVSLAPCCREIYGGRCGTAVITLAELEARVGKPHELSPNGKVKANWYIDTPRGPCQVGDYWWNKPDEISLRGNYKACLWAAAWLRNRLQIRATCRGSYELAQSL